MCHTSYNHFQASCGTDKEANGREARPRCFPKIEQDKRRRGQDGRLFELSGVQAVLRVTSDTLSAPSAQLLQTTRDLD